MDRWREYLLDVALAAALLALGLVGTAPAGRNQQLPVDGRAYALVVVAAAALLGRRHRPAAVLATSTVATSAYLVLGYPYGPVLLSYAVAVYTLAARRALWPAAVAAALSLTGLLLHVGVGSGAGAGWLRLLPAAAWAVVPFAVGVTVRVSREAVARTRADDARRLADDARRLADDERLRVAREVHDVVGHGLAAINMQAEIALHLVQRRPEQAQTALAAISRTSKEALDELRATLSVVRDGGRADDRAPGPGLARLDELVARTRSVGVPVTVDVAGRQRRLAAPVDLAAYRIVQESLTNVLRHAGAARATVRLTYEPEQLRLEITDTGVGGPEAAAVPGHGLGGMRERVTALGGTFAAGPQPGGGFRVAATLPVPA